MSVPPLPKPVATASDGSADQALRGGCWLISWRPSLGQPLNTYDGTLRVEPTVSGSRTVSGDLYQRPFRLIRRPGRPPIPVLGAGPNPAQGIPIQARAQYRYYLRVTSIGAGGSNGSSLISYEKWKYEVSDESWANEGVFSATLVWSSAPAGYPSSSNYAEGDVKTSNGAIVGRLTIGWISASYRKASIEIDTAPGCKVPTESGLGQSWDSVFKSLGWDVTVSGDETNVTLASVASGQWTDAQMHEAMLAHRRAVNLDAVWYFHILSVNIILSTPRGIMYDANATDSNNVPREGVGIGNDWIVPNDPEWGSEQGKKFANSKPLFFRTAVHELGHAMGLFHDTADNGFMNTTDVIAASGTATNPFPNNIKWQYATQGLRGLRHYPDPYVRPGGVEFGRQSFSDPAVADVNADQLFDKLDLKVTPLQSEVPLGAPVRLSIELVNSGDSSAIVPADISLKSEYVRGEVKKADGGIRTFKPLIHCVDDTPGIKELNPGESIHSSLTLLRGGQGALFHSSGLFDVGVTLRWPLGEGVFATQSGHTTVFVLPPENAVQAKAAHAILTTPDTQLVLVMGQARKGHLKEGVDAIKAATDDNVLGEHYAAVEARRLLQLGDEERVQRALKLIEGKVVICSDPEKAKLQRLLKKAQEDGQYGDDANRLVEQKLA